VLLLPVTMNPLSLLEKNSSRKKKKLVHSETVRLIFFSFWIYASTYPTDELPYQTSIICTNLFF
jgi:hypothetical protein